MRAHLVISSSITSSSSSSHRRHQHHHHISSGMPVNVWGVDRRDVWRTCICVHVRTATIFIGVLHLMKYILALSFVAAKFMYEPGQDVGFMVTIKPDPLPTPQSKSAENSLFPSLQEPKMLPYSQADLGDMSQKRLDGRSPFPIGVDTRRPNSQSILLDVCYMLITLLMVYGAVRGKPSYLMPFFVLKVFEFCIYCLKMVGYFSFLPNVTDMITQQPDLPLREELLRMDPQLLSLLALIVIVSYIAIQAYIIGVIWNCYKYLMLRNTVIRGVIAYSFDEHRRPEDASHMLGIQQNLLPDLPDYETAVNDPRYAKKPPLDPSSSSAGTAHGIHSDSTMIYSSTQPSTMGLPPPPPYSAAIAAEPVLTSMPIPEIVSAPPQIPQQTQQQQTQLQQQQQQLQQTAATTLPVSQPPTTMSTQQYGSEIIEIPETITSSVAEAPAAATPSSGTTTTTTTTATATAGTNATSDGIGFSAENKV